MVETGAAAPVDRTVGGGARLAPLWLAAESGAGVRRWKGLIHPGSPCP